MNRVRQARWGCGYVLLAVAGLTLATARPLDAASFALTPNERDEAIRTGTRSVVNEDFGGEWRVAGEAPGQTLTVVTAFHRLAQAARISAFKSQALRQRDIDSLLRDQEGRLVLWATFRGPKPDFARFYAPALVRGGQEIKASFTQNERTALREEDGRYTARCMYVFPVAELDPKGKVTLVVKDPDDKPVGRFTVDLSAMR
jgi:hypothetical protein